jgi:Zn-finger nucleic acid-binding protein
MIFLGSKFCPHCGARVGRTEEEDEKVALPCPHCEVALKGVELGPHGTVKMHECPKCEGFWVDVATFEAICTDREEQAIVAGGASGPPLRAELKLEGVRYLRCPTCRTLMNRVNFAGRSGVIIDTCRGHGTWFDKGELQNIVEFIRTGGLEQTRERGAQEARKPAAAPVASIEPVNNASTPWHSGNDLVDVLWWVSTELARLFLR